MRIYGPNELQRDREHLKWLFAASQQARRHIEQSRKLILESRAFLEKLPYKPRPVGEVAPSDTQEGLQERLG